MAQSTEVLELKARITALELITVVKDLGDAFDRGEEDLSAYAAERRKSWEQMAHILSDGNDEWGEALEAAFGRIGSILEAVAGSAVPEEEPQPNGQN